MRDLSMHVLDIAQNSIQAEAKQVSIDFLVDERRWLTLTVEDDGTGMPSELFQKVMNPFTTTRTTRRVGLGIPLLLQSAESSGGQLTMRSEPGEGTILTATFDLNHIDCPPMGNMCDSLLSLVVLNPDKPEFVFTATAPGKEASFDTRVLREAMAGLPLNGSDIIAWMRETIEEEFKPILEG